MARPLGDVVRVRHHGADGGGERHDQHEQQHERHDAHGEPALAPQRALHRFHQWPRSDDDHHRPDDRAEEGLQDPERRRHQRADEQHAQDNARQVVFLCCLWHGRPCETLPQRRPPPPPRPPPPAPRPPPPWKPPPPYCCARSAPAWRPWYWRSRELTDSPPEGRCCGRSPPAGSCCGLSPPPGRSPCGRSTSDQPLPLP